MANGGWIVSQPDTSPIRLECPLDSTLPELLRQAGQNVRSLGTHERLLPVTEKIQGHGRNNKAKRQQVCAGMAGFGSSICHRLKPESDESPFSAKMLSQIRTLASVAARRQILLGTNLPV
jgi:hypothetical protein